MKNHAPLETVSKKQARDSRLEQDKVHKPEPAKQKKMPALDDDQLIFLPIG